MRIFLFLTLSLLVWGCSTIEVTKEVIKVTNTVTDKVKESIPKKKIQVLIELLCCEGLEGWVHRFHSHLKESSLFVRPGTHPLH